ncbi:ATP-dependent Clp protease ATP-binding subunit [Isachenkonia alkalipeptolytica]|uniref:ATP-dependent Clp protease ATP-binding subunit n=1 Tax=Isachenkonia alkalipeptolytica TaxID=2565777 RepID=A0AA43XJN5_9CLOT|nr:ATP-dependent Clp protease ATP-binding subunit [Isachenkonia alkalipeptolytica]NBG88088.1 ATP-dependent Clp protease ATP-binding subunit [Isachenkonia alkalipeptolytica]
MKKCSVCKKNVAVIFAADMKEKDSGMKGLCVPCAKKMGLPIVDQIMEQTGMSEEEVEGLIEQMNHMFDNIEDGEDAGNEEGNNPFMKLLNGANKPNSDKKDPSRKKEEKKPEKEKPLNQQEHPHNYSEGESKSKEKTMGNPFKKKKKFLDLYGSNLTDKANDGEVDRIIGRHREIDRVVQILNRRNKNNPILIGEPGVGKTAIAEGLAVRIVDKEVPAKLFNTEIYLLDLTAIVAGTQFRGQFEGRMKSIVKEANDLGNVILVIDEVHNIMGAGEVHGGVMNAANILKPSLAKGEIQIIGATTLEEYRKHIEKDAALERRFQPVMVEEPNISDSIEIVSGVKDYYEKYHSVKVSEAVIEAAVKLSERYINDRYLPDKAIDVLDEAGSRANLKNKGLVELAALEEELEILREKKEFAAEHNDYEKAAEYKAEELMVLDKIEKIRKETENIEITVEDIAYVIETWTRIPVQKITEEEAKKLLDLEERMHRRVIGQEKGISSLAKTIRRNRSGFRKLKKPASFIFVGPTGVGKTESVRTLAHELFGDEEAMIRIDMSEYMEKHTVSKLIGAPPGYVGYDQGGQLTEKVRRKPYSVILLDEIEKAHPDVFNMLLQILEDGRLTDNQGRTVHFDNTVIVMTSNVGTNAKANTIGFSQNGYAAMESRVRDKLKETFRPEFLNRVDDIVVFTELSKAELKKIIDLMIWEVRREALEQNIELSVTEEVKDLILEKGYDQKYGARPLRRTVQRLIEDEIAEMFLKGIVTEGSKVEIYVEEGKLQFHVEQIKQPV